MLKIGFIGLGTMGLPMVENLAKVMHYQVFVHDRRLEQLDPLKNMPQWGISLFGARLIADLEPCEIVITMLPNSAITNQVIEELATVLHTGTLVIDMGSSNPMDTLALAQLLSTKGIHMVDAPVSGAVVKAKSGALAIMAGGEHGAVERALPVLKKIGQTVIKTGSIASAHSMKALNNYVLIWPLE